MRVTTRLTYPGGGEPAKRSGEYRAIVRRLSFPRAALRRVRVEHGSRADAQARTALAEGRTWRAARGGFDVRGRGHGLGGGPRHDRRGPRLEGVRRALRH